MTKWFTRVCSHYLVCHEVCRVETHTELTDHGDVSSGLEGLHEGLGARLGDGTQVVDQVGLGHANTAVDDGQGLVLRIGHDLDEKLFLGLKLGGICRTESVTQSITKTS